MVGSTMVRSPLFWILMYCFGCFDSYCSAMRGEMLGLNPPTPMPNMIRPMEKAAMEPLGLAMTDGIVAMTRIM